MNGTGAFEVLRFTGAPVGPDVALLELEGRFAERAPRGRSGTLLVVESAEETLELAPSAAGPQPEGGWRAVFAVPLAVVGGAVYSLAVGRHLLLDLPAPDMADATGAPVEHHVRLAREANDLRARLDAAESVRDAAMTAAHEANAGVEAESTAHADAEAALARAMAELEEARAAHQQAEAALAEATARTDERVAEARAGLEREATAAREQAARELAAAREEGERKLAGAHAEAERREEEAIAAERARASVTSHELRSARAEIEALKRELGVRRAASARSTAGNGTGEEITARRTRATTPVPAEAGDHAPTEATRRVAPLAARAEGPEREGEEGVRILSARPPRPRHRLEDETEPSTLPPGAAAIGARSFEPAGHTSGSTRALAIAALAVGMLAAILVIVLRVGVF